MLNILNINRDGRTIPHVPFQGKVSYPLIVMPHGGPFVSETIVWDTWSQLLKLWIYGYTTSI